MDKKTGEKSKTRPRFVKQDQVCIARLRTAGTICLETFKDFPQMGRFTLRDEGQYHVSIGYTLNIAAHLNSGNGYGAKTKAHIKHQNEANKCDIGDRFLCQKLLLNNNNK